jgi:hypothetical protein
MMKKCLWVGPEVVAQIEFLEIGLQGAPQAFSFCYIMR